MADRPNVLFVIADQHNAKILGHRGHPDVKTPHLDRLAADGMRFENAVVQNPICTPSRVSFLSGQYCHNHGYYGLGGPRPAGLPTVLGHFRRAGYTTAAIGKIHCPEYWVEDDCDVFREASPGCSSGGNPEYRAYLEQRGGLGAWQRSEGRRGSHGQCLDGFPSEQSYRDSPEGWVVTESIAFMARAAGEGRPFLLHASFPKPHQVYCPAQEFWDLYDGELTLPPNADYEMLHKAPHLKRMARSFRQAEWVEFEPRTYEAGRLRKLRGYLGCISHVDHAVGELLDWLRDNGLDGNTIVVYTSDHGDYACEHGIIEKAPGICADAITRVPLLWRWPGRVKAAHVAGELVESVDLSVTLCRLAGLPVLETSDGVDLSPLLAGGSGQVRRLAVTEFAWSKAVRKGDWRLVYYPPEMFAEEYPSGFGELYDLAADPWEMRNLYFEPDRAEIVRELERDLLDWLVTTTRPCTTLGMDLPRGDQTITRFGRTMLTDLKIPPRAVGERTIPNYL